MHKQSKLEDFFFTFGWFAPLAGREPDVCLDGEGNVSSTHLHPEDKVNEAVEDMGTNIVQDKIDPNNMVTILTDFTYVTAKTPDFILKRLKGIVQKLFLKICLNDSNVPTRPSGKKDQAHDSSNFNINGYEEI